MNQWLAQESLSLLNESVLKKKKKIIYIYIYIYIYMCTHRNLNFNLPTSIGFCNSIFDSHPEKRLKYCVCIDWPSKWYSSRVLLALKNAWIRIIAPTWADESNTNTWTRTPDADTLVTKQAWSSRVSWSKRGGRGISCGRATSSAWPGSERENHTSVHTHTHTHTRVPHCALPSRRLSSSDRDTAVCGDTLSAEWTSASETEHTNTLHRQSKLHHYIIWELNK